MSSKKIDNHDILEKLDCRIGDTIIRFNPLKDNVVEVAFFDECGGVFKDIEAESLLKLLKGSAYNIFNETKSFVLPETGQYFQYGDISIDQQSHTTFHLVPGKVRDFLFVDEVFKVPFPNLLFKFDVEQKKIVNTSVYCVKKESISYFAGRDRVSSTPKIYRFPFPNVSSTGRVCWGNNRSQVNSIETILDLDYLIEIFFMSAFNVDHFNHNDFNIPTIDFASMKREQQIVSLINYLSEYESFPEDILVQTHMLNTY